MTFRDIRRAVLVVSAALAVACGGGGGSSPPPPPPPVCDPVLSALSTSIAAAGGTASVGVTVASGCAWTATSDAGWITVTAGASGSGAGTVSFTVAANPGGLARSGTLTVAGETFTVDQLGVGCSASLSAASADVGAALAAGSVDVAIAAGCAWTAAPQAAWITLTGGAAGDGGGTVSFSAAANPSGLPRSGTITIAGQTFTVSQAGLGCAATLSPASAAPGAAGGATSVDVQIAPDCTWTATTATAWITLTAGTSGTGPGTLQYAAAANPSGLSRSGAIAVAGRTFAVTQAGLGCAATPSPAGASPGAAGGLATVDVAVAPDCAWTAASDAGWLEVLSGAGGTGSGTVQYRVAPNASAIPRTGTLTVAGQLFTVQQGGVACTYALVPESGSFGAGAASGSVTVAAPEGCAWGATSAAAWLTITAGASGSGPGSVQYAVAANATPASRIGTLFVGGRTFTVTQGGAACTYAVSPATATVGPGAGTGSLTVSAAGGCGWAAASGAPWLSVTAGSLGSGSGGVQYDVEANPAAAPRSATITVAGQTHEVTQEAAACAFALSPASHTAPAAGGVGSVLVSAPVGCGWTAASSAAWLTITSGGSGDRGATVAYRLDPNPSALSRTATLTVAGETHTVTQAGVGCTYALSRAGTTVGAGGASEVVNVTAPAGCGWTASSVDAWLTVAGGASGDGNGVVQLAIEANPAGVPRSGSVAIAGEAFEVAQDPAPCAYALVPETTSFVAAGGAGSLAVDTIPGCAWSATSGAAWITVVGGAPGTGDGSVQFTVDANADVSSRSGTLTAGGKTFTVVQGGAGCAYALSPASAAASAEGSTGSVTITAQAGCTWIASADVAWIGFPSGAAGSGGGTLAYAVAANPSASARSGTVTVGGQAHAVTQAGAACAHVISPAAASYLPEGGLDAVTVSAPVGCGWTATSGAAWLTIGSGASGDGPGTVRFSVAPNAAGASRSGTLTIAGRTFTATQGGVGCSYAIDPAGTTAPSAGRTGTVAVTAPAGCAWSAAAQVPWIAVTSGASGSGSGTVGYSVAANAATEPRTGTALVAGRSFTVAQDPAACTYAITPDQAELGAAAGSGTLSVVTTPGCGWTASSSATWLTVTSGASGSGPGLVGFAVAENPGDASRSATLTVADRSFAVTQRWGGEIIIIVQ